MKTILLEDRLRDLAGYYKIQRCVIAELAAIPHNQRKELCRERGIDPCVFRTMADYTRYPESQWIDQTLTRIGESITQLAVLDFGCLVADYGMHFARRGATVAIYGWESETQFAKSRFAKEGLTVQTFSIPTNYATLFSGRNLVVFGEVLEHLEYPLQALQFCVDRSVKYIFTSCYPYGDNEYFRLNGHRKSAQTQQPACIDLLETGYIKCAQRACAVLWQRISQ